MIVRREEMAEISQKLHGQNKKIAFTNGCFDIIHAGHTRYLAEARKAGDLLVVGLNTDSSVKRLKGETRPVNSENDRAEVLDALRSVDYVVMFGEDTPYELICEIQPDALVKGGDYTFETIVGAEMVSAAGGRVLTVPLVEGKSTTAIIRKMNC